MVDYSKKKVAVVLSGGSAKGFAHIGVLKGLEEMGIKPSLIVGTSMGAIIGALYCWNPSWKWVVSEVKKHKMKDMFSVKEFLNLKKGLIKGNRFESIFRKVIRDADFKELKIPLVINATDVVSKKTIAFTKGNVEEAVRASISVPLVFNPLKKGKMVLVDGGLTDNLFFEYVIPKASRYDLFILVDTGGRPRKFKKEYSVLGLTMQCLGIMMRNQINLKLQLLEKDNTPNAKLFRKKMVYIAPNLNIMTATQFSRLDIAIKKGHSAFLKSKKDIVAILKKRR